jgi:putative ABC transport system substrate-binding protein
VRRRAFIVMCAAVTTCPPLARGQSTANQPRRIGGLFAQALSDPTESGYWAALLEGLREYGWVEGQNLIIEGRWAEGRPERFGPFAAELVARGDVEVIVAFGTFAMREARARTATIPIVTISANDPVSSGLAASLARPGGNVTGIAMLATELQRKQVSLLRELIPDLRHLAILWDPSNLGSRLAFEDLESIALSVDLSLVSAPVRSPADLDQALSGHRHNRCPSSDGAPDALYFSAA